MRWWIRLVRRSRADEQLNSELRFHLEQQIADYVACGVSADEARRRARLEFGGVDQVREEVHDAQRGHFLETLLQDIRYGVRMLRKSPGFTAVAIITLALGIGANTAIFSLINGVLLSPLPFRDPSRLVGINQAAYPKGAYAIMRDEVHTMDVAIYSQGDHFNLTGVGQPLRLNGTLVSANFFSVLGAQPELGNTFASGQDLAGRDGYVILSNRLWHARFSGDRSAIGRVISLEGVPRQIIGIMPASFHFPSAATDVWVPLGIDPRNASDYWAQAYMPILGRLNPGVTIAQVDAEIRLFQSHVRTMFPWPMPKDWNAGLSVEPLQSILVGNVRSWLLILLAAVALVLLIACANVANLTLSRASTRAKEIAIRNSLGAGRSRILRQLITESIVTALAGGILGIVLASSALSLLKTAFPADTPGLANIVIDWRVLFFTAILSIGAGVISSVVPAIQSSSTDLTHSLKASGRGLASSSRYARRALVVGEIGLAVLLVSSAGLLIRSLWMLAHVYLGFVPQRLYTARITPDESFCDDPDRCVQFYRQVVSRVQALPGVTDAAVINTLPLDGRVNKRSLDLEGKPNAQLQPLVWQNIVSENYFRVMHIRLLRGRAFSQPDTAGNPPVAILSASTAQKFWPNQNAVGKHIRLADTTDWLTVVGVVSDVRAFSLQQNVPTYMDGAIYLPYGPKATMEDTRMPAEMTLAVHTAVDEPGLADSIRGIVASLNQDAPVSEIKTMATVMSDATSAPRSVTSLFVAFAFVAFLLGAVGIYGVIAFFVGQRTREIGIRMALGAQKRDVLKIVLREGLSMTGAGIVAGLVAALALTRLLHSLLYGVSATDPAALGTVVVLFAVVAIVACYVPARRAMRVDPVIALREE
ncbi:MAG TPA: ABC transporter permease [Candidatus Acidoferrum sp.]|nr:ABC transporter permease [Candidatus Acidoferrum sp.]